MPEIVLCVVGVTFANQDGSSRQAILERVFHRYNQTHESVQFLLIPESTNAHDANAVSVHAVGIGQVGYLSREDAPLFRCATAKLANVYITSSLDFGLSILVNDCSACYEF